MAGLIRFIPLVLLVSLISCSPQMTIVKNEIGRQKIELSVEEVFTAKWFICENATVASHRIVFPTLEDKQAIEVICK